jgi:hypothetical protein
MVMNSMNTATAYDSTLTMEKRSFCLCYGDRKCTPALHRPSGIYVFK